MNSALNDMSIVYWYPDREKHRCGYCKNDYGSISNGMWTESLTVEDYQNLIDRGWRRSGKYCYKPIMDDTCCPQYTIKCDIKHFLLTKSQKKVVKKFNKYLEDGLLNKNDFSEAQHNNGPETSSVFIKDRPNINFSKINNGASQMEMDNLEVHCDQATGEPHCDKSSDKLFRNQTAKCELSPSQKRLDLKSTFKEGVGADSSKPPCKKARILRLERKKEKLFKQGLTFGKKDPAHEPKSIEQFLEEVSQNCKHKLRITLGRMSQDHEFFAVSAKLFEKYQTIVHNEAPEDSDPDQFCSFLVESPLEPVDFPDGIDGPGYGSFHQQYWIDDKLIAVGVIDILPRCVSSVYFFYDPDYRNLTLGTYGSLREVQFTRSLNERLPELSNYYMGFYIHSCPKMRYKGKLSPSFLLCPETYHWIPIEKCMEKLEASKYSRLEEDIDAVDENFPTSKDVDEMKVLYDYRIMYFRQYKRHRAEEQNLFNNIAALIGKKCTKSLIFCMN